MEKLNNLGAVCTAGSLQTTLPALREPRRRPCSIPPRHQGQHRSPWGLGLSLGLGLMGTGHPLNVISSLPAPGLGHGGMVGSSGTAWREFGRCQCRGRSLSAMENIWKRGSNQPWHWWGGGMGKCDGPWGDQTCWTKIGWAQVSRCTQLRSIPSQFPLWLLPLERGIGITLQATGTSPWPKFPFQWPCPAPAQRCRCHPAG